MLAVVLRMAKRVAVTTRAAAVKAVVALTMRAVRKMCNLADWNRDK